MSEASRRALAAYRPYGAPGVPETGFPEPGVPKRAQEEEEERERLVIRGKGKGYLGSLEDKERLFKEAKLSGVGPKLGGFLETTGDLALDLGVLAPTAWGAAGRIQALSKLLGKGGNIARGLLAAPVWSGLRGGAVEGKGPLEVAKDVPEEALWWGSFPAAGAIMRAGGKHGPQLGERAWKALEPARKRVMRTRVIPTEYLSERIFHGKTLEDLLIPAVDRMKKDASRAFRKTKVMQRHMSKALADTSARIMALEPEDRVIIQEAFRKGKINALDTIDQKETVVRALAPLKETYGEVLKGLKTAHREVVESKFQDKVAKLFMQVDDPALQELGKSFPLIQPRGMQRALKTVLENPSVSPETRLLARDLYDLPAHTADEIFKAFRESSEALLFSKVKANKAWVSAAPKEGFVLSRHPSFKGLWVDKHINDGLLELSHAQTEALRVINKYILTPWKVTRVVTRWSSQFRNAVGNVILNDIFGKHPLPVYRQDVYLGALKSMAKNDHDFKGFVKLTGVDPGTWASTEIREFEAALKANASLPEVMVNYFYKAARPFSKAFQFFETHAKYAKYRWNLKQGMQRSDAALDAIRSTFDYSEVTRFTRGMRSTVAPFFTWQSKVLTALPEAAVKHPIRLAKYFAIPAAITSASLKNLRMSESEFEEIKNDLPDYIKHGWFLLAPYRDERGRLQMMNLTWWVPGLGDVSEIYANLRHPTRFMQNPVVTLTSDLLKGTKGSGEPLYEDAMDAHVKLGRILYYLYQQTMPTWLPGGIDFQQLYDAATSRPEALTLSQAALSQFGIKLAPVDPDEAARKAAVAKEVKARRLRSWLIKNMRKSPEEEHEALIEKYQKWLGNIYPDE